MPRSRRIDPDYVVDVDRGSSEPGIKRAQVLTPQAYADRAEIRDGARELDQAVETMPGLSRQRRDRERAMPRDLTSDVRHPRLDRELPVPDSIRQPLSSRQRKARSVTKRTVQDRLPLTQYAATARLVSDPAYWRRLNDPLSDAAGDVQELPDTQRRDVQRVDRAVQAYERANDRGHVVYANVQLPAAINQANVEGCLRHKLRPGTTVAFDRFTGGAHTLHEVEVDDDQRTAVLEIRTRRGMYLGRSDSVDDTAHLLPRGLRLRVESPHLARYRRPNGTLAARHVIQLTDIDTTPTAGPATSDH